MEILIVTVLNDIYDFLGRFIVYPSDETRVAHTLWIAHAHLIDEWYITPRLLFLSPTRETGKTRAMQVTNLLVPNGILTVNATAPYIFRRLAEQEKGLPTLMYDEIDTIFSIRGKKDTEELRGLLNSGYKKGATIGRCVGEKHETQDFPVYCAVALAGIDELDGFDTVKSRSIIIEMKRRKPDEVIERYRDRDIDPEGIRLRERLAEFSTSLAGIGDDRPKMPSGMSDRQEEIWEPLLAIADRAGGNWLERARVAAVALVAPTGKARGDLGTLLLSDLRTVFEGRDKFHTNSIINVLNNIEESPWSGIDNNKPINARLLADMLRPYKITPRDIRIGGTVLKGYYKDDFTDAFDRYLPSGQEGYLPKEGQRGEAETPLPLPTAATRATAAIPATEPVAPLEAQEQPQTLMPRELTIRDMERLRITF
jgi:Protein of unknown function (DUF3631)